MTLKRYIIIGCAVLALLLTLFFVFHKSKPTAPAQPQDGLYIFTATNQQTLRDSLLAIGVPAIQADSVITPLAASFSGTGHADIQFLLSSGLPQQLSMGYNNGQTWVSLRWNNTFVLQQEKDKVVPDGGSIFALLLDMGLTQKEVGRYVQALGENVDMSLVQPGDTLKVRYWRDELFEVIYKPDLITSHVIRKAGDNLVYSKQVEPVEVKYNLVDGKLEGTLDGSLTKLGFEPWLKQQVNNALQSEVNFSTQARKDDDFKVLVEEHWYKNRRLPRSKLLYAFYDGRVAGKHEAYRFDDPESESSALNGMYTPAGKTLMQNAIRSPLNDMHVVSPFGMRIHPISGTWKMHDGIDYRARFGTPVYAVADGKVIGAAYNGGYGNEVRLQHNGGYMTNYAHLSSIRVRRGQSVSKGSVVGLVGSTGYSSGAHLHFGLKNKVNGPWVNPKSLKMVGSVSLEGSKWTQFSAQVDKIRQILQKVSPPPAAR